MGLTTRDDDHEDDAADPGDHDKGCGGGAAAMPYCDMMESVCTAYDLDRDTTALWWRQDRPELKAGFGMGYV